MTHTIGGGRCLVSKRAALLQHMQRMAAADEAGRKAESVPNGGAAEPICLLYNQTPTIEQKVDEIQNGGASLPVGQSNVQMSAPSQQVNLLLNGRAPFQVHALSQVNAFPANAQTSMEAPTAPIPPWRAAPRVVIDSSKHLVAKWPVGAAPPPFRKVIARGSEQPLVDNAFCQTILEYSRT